MTKDEALKMAIEAMNSAYSNHGLMLQSNPAQDAWLYHGCDAKLFKALQACKEALEQPSWKGLSNDMVRAIGEKCEEKNRGILNWIDFYNGIEDMLKDKNHG